MWDRLYASSQRRLEELKILAEDGVQQHRAVERIAARLTATDVETDPSQVFQFAEVEASPL